MTSKIQRWGNSQGLRVPKRILERADISVGDLVEMIPQEGGILIKKVSKSKVDLAEVVSRMPRDYQVHEEPTGPPQGKEVW